MGKNISWPALRYRFVIPAFLFIHLSALSGCSGIFEDRSDCPCYLTLLLDGCDPSRVRNLHVWLFDSSGDILRRDTLYGGEYGNGYRVLVKRDMVECRVWGNITEATYIRKDMRPEAILLKKQTLSADSLFFYGSGIHTEGEEVSAKVVLRKEFLTVKVLLKNAAETGYPVGMQILSGSEGLDINGKPVAGTGVTAAFPEPGEGEEPEYRFRLLRQEECAGIRLLITDGPMDQTGSSEVLKEYPLGEWLVQNGYDMKAENLSDVEIEIDFSASLITVSAEDWRETYPVDVEF